MQRALAVSVVLLVGLAGPAEAQEVKGRVMVLVDTSGSMVWHFGDNTTAGGDGDLNSRFTDVTQSNENYYPGIALGGGLYDGVNSRLYAAKHALTNVVSGSAALDFGLMRYRPATNRYVNGVPRCADPLNCCDLSVGACVCQGDYVDNPGGSACSRASAGLTTWSGSCGDMQGGVSLDGAQILVAPGAGSSRQVLTWVDGVEDFRAGGPNGFARNGELRAAGPTPLAGSVRSAIADWYQPVLDHTRANPNCDPATDALCDPQIDCRPYVFVVMTDGADSCEGCPDADGNCGFHQSQSDDPPALVGQLYGLNSNNPVKTYVIGLAFVPGDPGRAVLDSMASAGGTGQARFAGSSGAIESAFADIVSSSVKYEVCNDLDDNCNGLVDEDFPDKGAKCTVGVGACQREGVRKCDPADDTRTTCCVDDGQPGCTPLQPGAPSTEACNQIDDDCNGVIDDGTVCQKCTPTAEVCNGLDDDCDGIVDDNLVDTGKDCGLSLGACKPGKTACVPASGKSFPDPSDHLVCQGATPRGTETCNGIDDDCDGVVDGMSRLCYDGPAGTEGKGICRGGRQACTAKAGSGVASWGACVGEVLPRTEICDGQDDDCDGTVDDVAGAGADCCPSGLCGTGICKAGKLTCSGGRLECVGGQGPLPEQCDGKDDDCDGKVDDLPTLGHPCSAPGSLCPGHLACDGTNKQVVCAPDPGGGKEVCNGLDDDCDGMIDEEPDVSANDPRLGKPCGNDQSLPAPCMAGTTVCERGAVVCKGAVGPQPELCDCKDNDCNGKVDDNALCPDGTECYECGCYARCGGGEFPCPGGYVCDKNGFCVPDKTCSPPCGPGYQCVLGACVTTCGGVQCKPGEACCNGQCTPAAQCAGADSCKTCEVWDAAGARCVPDLCCHAQCAADQFCDPTDGKCYGICQDAPGGRRCLRGVCGPDLCAAIECPEGQACNPANGQCVADQCVGMSCPAGYACVGGSCVDALCGRTTCPDGTRCAQSALDGTVCCERPSDSGPFGGGGTAGGTGGDGGTNSGCSCALGARDRSRPGHSAAWLGALLVALGLVRRKRARS